MIQNWRWVLSLPLILTAVVQGGPITVTPTVTANGPLFHYNYSVTNGTGNDLAVLDILVAPGASTVQNLTSPAGFSKAFDPVLGLVSFLEDSGMFGASPISGFAFDSPLPAKATTFNATLLDSNFNVSTMTGATTGPAAVPEPGYLPLLSLALPVFWFLHFRSKRSVSNHVALSSRRTQ